MLLAHPEDRRRVEDETERALSPLSVAMQWDYGDFVLTISGENGSRTERIDTAGISWEDLVKSLQSLREELRRAGFTLDDWHPPLPAPELQDTPPDSPS